MGFEPGKQLLRKTKGKNHKTKVIYHVSLSRVVKPNAGPTSFHREPRQGLHAVGPRQRGRVTLRTGKLRVKQEKGDNQKVSNLHQPFPPLEGKGQGEEVVLLQPRSLEPLWNWNCVWDMGRTLYLALGLEPEGNSAAARGAASGRTQQRGKPWVLALHLPPALSPGHGPRESSTQS